MKESNNNSPVDLGLTELLSEPSIQADATPELSPNSDEIGDSAVRTGAQQTLFDDFEFFAVSKSWNEIARRAESFESGAALASPSPDRQTQLDCKAWWIKAQLEIGQMPAIILAAPLQLLVQELRDYGRSTEKTKDLIGRILLRVADQIGLDSQDWEVSLDLYSSASQVNPSLREQVQDKVNSALNPLRKNPLFGIDSSLTEREKSLVGLIRAGSEKSDLGVSAVFASPPKGEPDPKYSPGYAGVSVGKYNALPKRSKIKLVHIALFSLFLITVSLGLLLFTVDGTKQISSLFGLSSSTQGSLASPSSASEKGNSAPALQRPEPQRVERVNSLDAIFYELNKIKSAVLEPSGEPPQQGSAQDSRSASSAANSSSGSSGSSAGSEVGGDTGTVGQIAQRENRQQQTIPAQAQQVNTVTPVLDADYQRREQAALAQDREALRDSEPKVPLFPEDRKSAGSRNPQDQAMAPAVGSKKQESYEPRKSVRGERFEVIAPTSVLSEPNFSASVVSRLSPGDEVEAEAHLGTWVRVVSRRGRVGFVLAQDLVSISSGRR